MCSVPSAWCLPSVGCPVPSQGSLLDPRSQAQKGRLVRKARPSQAAGLPHFARVRTGLFPFIFLFQDLSCQLLYFNSTPDSEFFSQNSPVRRAKVHFPWWWFILPLVHPSGLSLLWKCFPASTSNKYWKRFLSWATIPYHTISFLGRPYHTIPYQILSWATGQKTMEDKGKDGRRRHGGPGDQK